MSHIGNSADNILSYIFINVLNKKNAAYTIELLIVPPLAAVMGYDGCQVNASAKTS